MDSLWVVKLKQNTDGVLSESFILVVVDSTVIHKRVRNPHIRQKERKRETQYVLSKQMREDKSRNFLGLIQYM